jgi:DNA-binding response OmpR family regulator
VITGDRRPSRIRLGRLRIDPAGSTAYLGGRELPLTAKEFGLLLALARRPGAFVSRDRLMAEVWGDPGSRSRTLAIHVRRLRAKLGAYAAAIETRVRVGYRVNPTLLREESGSTLDGNGLLDGLGRGRIR